MTVTIEDAKRILSDVDKKSAFKFSRGHEILNLEGLYEELKTISYDDYKHHVNSERNDFANWVEGCLGDKHLALALRETTDKDDALDTVKSRIFVLKLMTVLKEEFPSKEEQKIEALVEKQIEQIENESRISTKPHYLPRHDISNLKDDKKVLSDIKKYISEMEKNEENIVKELEALETENKGLQKLFTKNFLHGFLLGLASGILIMIIALKLLLMTNGI